MGISSWRMNAATTRSAMCGAISKGSVNWGRSPSTTSGRALKQMELDADRCAVKMLKATHEPEAIEAARQMMLQFGTKPTGAYYPTGIERADNIARTAAEE